MRKVCPLSHCSRTGRDSPHPKFFLPSFPLLSRARVGKDESQGGQAGSLCFVCHGSLTGISGRAERCGLGNKFCREYGVCLGELSQEQAAHGG